MKNQVVNNGTTVEWQRQKYIVVNNKRNKAQARKKSCEQQQNIDVKHKSKPRITHVVRRG